MQRLKEKICAVVVTYNRKILLQECLDALLGQSYTLDSIIVVDNASTDGTRDMLDEKYLSNPIFDYFNTGENIGGAGGFHEGMKRAYEKGYDWIWVMDDDGKPDLHCLEQMLSVLQSDKNCAYMPLITTKDNELTWRFRIKESNSEIIHVRDMKIVEHLNNNLYPTYGVGLLGGLYSANIFKNYGYPDKRLFIRGDDDEYNMRLMKNNVKTYFIKDARFYHPREEVKYVRFLNKDIKYYDYAFPNLKIYFQLRNQVLNIIEYSSHPYLEVIKVIIIQFMLLIYGFKFSSIFLNRFKVIFLSIFHGLTKRFNNRQMITYLIKLK